MSVVFFVKLFVAAFLTMLAGGETAAAALLVSFCLDLVSFQFLGISFLADEIESSRD